MFINFFSILCLPLVSYHVSIKPTNCISSGYYPLFGSYTYTGPIFRNMHIFQWHGVNNISSLNWYYKYLWNNFSIFVRPQFWNNPQVSITCRISSKLIDLLYLFSKWAFSISDWCIDYNWSRRKRHYKCSDECIRFWLKLSMTAWNLMNTFHLISIQVSIFYGKILFSFLIFSACTLSCRELIKRRRKPMNYSFIFHSIHFGLISSPETILLLKQRKSRFESWF